MMTLFQMLTAISRALRYRFYSRNALFFIAIIVCIFDCSADCREAPSATQIWRWEWKWSNLIVCDFCTFEPSLVAISTTVIQTPNNMLSKEMCSPVIFRFFFSFFRHEDSHPHRNPRKMRNKIWINVIMIVLDGHLDARALTARLH